MATVFKNFPYEKKAFLNPEDTTKRSPGFPELCVSTFSENIIDEFVSAGNTEVIGQLYSANGTLPIYQIVYKNTPIACFLSRVGAPACIAGIEEIIALGAKKLVLFWKLRDLGCGMHPWKNNCSHICRPRRRHQLPLYQSSR